MLAPLSSTSIAPLPRFSGKDKPTYEPMERKDSIQVGNVMMLLEEKKKPEQSGPRPEFDRNYRLVKILNIEGHADTPEWYGVSVPEDTEQDYVNKVTYQDLETGRSKFMLYGTYKPSDKKEFVDISTKDSDGLPVSKNDIRGHGDYEEKTELMPAVTAVMILQREARLYDITNKKLKALEAKVEEFRQYTETKAEEAKNYFSSLFGSESEH